MPNINIRTPVISSRDRSTWKHLLGLPIPDCSSGQVELLLGANVLEAVIQREVRVGRPGQPVAIRTAFGWTLTGAVSDLVSGASKEVMLIERVDPEEQLMETIKQWWTTESLGKKFTIDGRRSKEDELAQKMLERNIKKCGNRCKASQLWHVSSVFIPNNQGRAISRLKSLEKSLLRDSDKVKAYKEVNQQYIDKGHVRKVPQAESAMDYGKRWFLPHRAITNPKKSKIRAIFDAAVSLVVFDAARGMIKRLLNRCIFCRNRRARPKVPLMGQSSRGAIRPESTLQFSWDGLFGLLQVRKFRKTENRDVILVTYLVIRALHLELASALDRDAFSWRYAAPWPGAENRG